MAKLYAFDVDDCLEIRGAPSTGPVKLQSLVDLRDAGHIVGVCGNWAVLTNLLPGWQAFVSFIGPFSGYKPTMLRQLKLYTHAQEYIMVGNDPSQWKKIVSDDADAARQAGYRFISEFAFAKGAR